MFRFQFGKKFLKLTVSVVLCGTFLFLILQKSNHEQHAEENTQERIDWQDLDFIEYELTRNGAGERSGFKLTDPDEIAKNDEALNVHGISLVVSDKISLTRALVDPRNEKLVKLNIFKLACKS